MGTYPRPHFCQPSTTPNTPLGKIKVRHLKPLRNVFAKVWSVSFTARPPSLLRPTLGGTSFAKKEKKFRLLLSPCEVQPRETCGWLVNIRFVLLVPVSDGQAESSSMHCLADHFSAEMLNCLTMVSSQILVSCLARQHSELVPADAESVYDAQNYDAQGRLTGIWDAAYQRLA